MDIQSWPGWTLNEWSGNNIICFSSHPQLVLTSVEHHHHTLTRVHIHAHTDKWCCFCLLLPSCSYGDHLVIFPPIKFLLSWGWREWLYFKIRFVDISAVKWFFGCPVPTAFAQSHQSQEILHIEQAIIISMFMIFNAVFWVLHIVLYRSQ